MTATHNRETIQEEQYIFPYHYLTSIEGDAISLSKHLPWGLTHISYIEYVLTKLSKEHYDSLIDAGCGDGRFLFELEKINSSAKLIGIDISERALFFARGFTRHATLKVHDIIRSPYPEPCDICISIEVIEHIPPQKIKDYISNIHASLNTGGVLILTTPTTNIPTNKKHYQHFTKDLLEEYLDSKFIIEEIEYLNIERKLYRILSRFLANKFFIVRSHTIRKLVFKLYKKYCLHGDIDSGSRIYIKAKKI